MLQMLKVYLKKFMIATLAPHMRSPSGITGWFARKIMRSANPYSTKHAIQNRMNLKSSDVFVELGAGEGAGLLAILEDDYQKIPSQIHLVEISESMRGELERVIREDLPPSAEKTDIRVYGEDCRSMHYLQDNSVDKIFAMNVVYFLDPLPEYLNEIHRVLKPQTGEIVWGCKFDKVPKDNEIFANVEEEKVVKMMEDAGFHVTSEKINMVPDQECPADSTGENNVDLSSDTMRNFIEVRGRKK